MSKTVDEKLDMAISELSIIKKMIESLAAAKTNARPAPAAGEVASDDLLSRPWADMEIARDPPRTREGSSVGKRMSQCTETYLLDYASFYEWKATKGREEDPPRLNNKGRPWYESDELIAKVARGWAARAAGAKGKPGLAKAKPKAAAAPGSMGDPDEEIPF